MQLRKDSEAAISINFP